MIGVAGGLVAAVLWGLSAIAAARSTRLIGAEPALAWVFTVGLAIALPVALALGVPDIDRSGSGWVGPTVVLTVAALYTLYAALSRGPVSLVVPITASQGALAAVLAVALGESLQGAAAAGLVVIFVGMFAVMRRPRAGGGSVSHPSTAIVFALALGRYCRPSPSTGPRGRARRSARPGCSSSCARAGVLSLGGPLLLSGRLRRPGRRDPTDRLLGRGRLSRFRELRHRGDARRRGGAGGDLVAVRSRRDGTGSGTARSSGSPGLSSRVSSRSWPGSRSSQPPRAR